MERQLILISGLPGSGKSHLGKNLADGLRANQTAEHISLGDRVREIGQGVINSVYADTIRRHLQSNQRHLPLDDEVVFDVASQALHDKQDADLILLDGYPRNLEQYFDVNQIAIVEDRRLRGMIITEASHEDMIARMIKRGPRIPDEYVDIIHANERLTQQRLGLDILHRELIVNRDHQLHLELIDTTGPKPTTLRMGMMALREMRA